MGREGGRAAQSDHTSPAQREIGFLGIESSPAFVRAPEGNGCAERFIRTLKENLLWVRHFETIEELRQALLAFREVYNTTWLIERHGLISPAAPSEATSTRRQGGVGFNPVSQKLQAVHIAAELSRVGAGRSDQTAIPCGQRSPHTGGALVAFPSVSPQGDHLRGDYSCSLHTSNSDSSAPPSSLRRAVETISRTGLLGRPREQTQASHVCHRLCTNRNL